MYSLEERTKAVKLFIESDCSESTVIRTLGYPSPNALRSWYKEYLSTGQLHSTCAQKPHYTDQQKAAAVAYFATHHTSLTQTCRAMGYPCRNKLRQWILEARPELLEESKKSCSKKKALVRCSQEQKQTAVEAMLIGGLPAYKVAAQYGVSKATVFNWKQQVLGRDGMASIKKEMNTVQTDKTKSEMESEIASLKLQIKHLQMERDALEKATELLKKAGGINLTNLKNTEKAEVIDALRPTYRLKELLQLFNISKSSYFYSTHAATHDKYAEIRPEIIDIFHQNELCYGYRRIHACLKRRGKTLSEKVVRRIMRQEHLIVHMPVRKKYSSYKGEISPEVLNVLQRNFHASAPNQKWLTDLTEFALPAGKVYLSPIIDCFDGFVCSWTIGTSPNAQLVNSMLDKALATLQPGEHPIIHSDRGCHYRWPDWIQRVNAGGLIRSMSKKGCSPDNSACEGFFGRLKNEMFYGRSWSGVSLEQFMEKLDQYIHWYNEKRIKLSLGGMSPVEYRRSLGLI
ncbi:MAG: IS3 family transposase [Bacillota bacterium]|nr:IS3 family transposase [Bacillota bacterium]